MNRDYKIAGAVGAGAGIIGTLIWWKSKAKAKDQGQPTKDKETPREAVAPLQNPVTLFGEAELRAQREIEKVLVDNSPIEWGDPRWPVILRKAKWEREWNPVGTTCSDYLGFIFEMAQLSEGLFENWGRFRTGAAFFKKAEQAKAVFRRPNLRLPSRGDAYQISEPGKASNFHVGFVWEATATRWKTIDGGQGPRNAQRVATVERPIEYRPEGVFVGGPIGFRRLDWVISSAKLLAAYPDK